MKLIIILGDGMADHPVERLGGKTLLQYANKPYMDMLAKKGKTGRLVTVPDGFHPGSAARQLLVDETLSITQISQHLGFEYPQHFVRFFKAQTGKTPSEYRKTA